MPCHSAMRETGLVPDYCTCGAELPPDARFCHKCGKPQREEPAAWVEEPVAPRDFAVPPSISVPPAPPEIGLRNSHAVRVGLLVGGLTFVLSLMPLPLALRFLFLLGAGAVSVYLYSRRSGFSLEVRSGARMGWMTGLFCFLIFTVLFTASIAVLSVVLRDATMEATYRQQLSAMGMSADTVQQALEALQSPVQVLGALLSAFVILTMIPALGGALGARLFRKN